MRALLLAGLLLSAPARADDRTACADGIAMIKDVIAKDVFAKDVIAKDVIAKTPPEAALPKLRKALRVAEREQGEGEFDECLDAVGDAKRALGR